MQTTLMQNSRGFTLIEVMFAQAIILIGLLGLLVGVNLALKTNTNNQQREEVVRVAENIMNDMRSQPFEAVFTPITTVNSTMKKVSAKYTVLRTSTPMTSGSLQYNVNVRWKYGNYSTTHAIVSVRGLQQ
ncbi:MAG: prepilin-type N-terminal cleavage/methylation domain-containing protein [Desulfuromonadaceae bacterium]|nr:prepilin-type N-terminal cleavage/methylation domain-containing protein [Desulfuromonadaceae bacterium]MDD2854089.1 prepilin-type N-terminal cleavage/methylation domain-containing protein [Desulfuromonadaceae bacterium]